MKALKLFALSIVTAASMNVFAQTAEQAADLYARRGTDVSFAEQAAEMYTTLAKTSSVKLEKAGFLINAARSFYYVGTHKEKDVKVNHDKGMDASTEAQNLLNPNKEAEKLAADEKLAYCKALYWYGANLGKWAEANGVASSLGRWPTLKNTMLKIINLGNESVESYGPARILGRAYYKLPFPLGSKSTSLTYLKKAVAGSTPAGQKVSDLGLNNIFLADTLLSLGKKKEAKQLLQDFVDADAQVLNAERLPETLEEQEDAKKKLERL